MKVVKCQQNTDEWLQARVGKVTSSRMADVLAKIKSGEAASRRDYKAEKVAEILLDCPAEDSYSNGWMQRGHELEPIARAVYELRYDVEVEQLGFVLHPALDRCGCSPDGLVGTDGMVEIKCPKTATHLQYILQGKVPADYQPQMLWQMACCERSWCDFASYEPRLPESMQLFVKRLERDDKRIAEMQAEVQKFLREVDDMVNRLKTCVDLQSQLEASLLITEGDIRQ